MPIYEFYCSDCHMIFNFFSRTVNTKRQPNCPKCGDKKLERQISLFSVTGKASEDDGLDDLPIDESKMERAMDMLAREADGIDENDPRQAANLMRKMSEMAGMELGKGMQEALQRMEAGEDPDQIEAEMGDRLEAEDPFLLPGKKGRAGLTRRAAPQKDETLYDL